MDAEELKRIIREEVEKVRKNKKARSSAKLNEESIKANEEGSNKEAENGSSDSKKFVEDNSKKVVAEKVATENESTVTSQKEEEQTAIFKTDSFAETVAIVEPDSKVDLDEIELIDLKNVQADSVLKFLKVLFEKWHQANSDAEDAIMKKIHRDSRKDLQPLFTNLTTLSPNILHLIAQMVSCMQLRDYVQANDAYLRLAIGNAPWPIGVDSVLIHERTSQAKIASNQVAHVLNDEVSRKWIQMLKRLITFCQKMRPPNDRSKLMP